ncbi:MAG: hypothetical protein ACHQDF_04160, partial [Chitinophagales bacterium]
GGNGHLSNLQALELFKNHRSSYLSHLLLSHLSKENNSPDLVQALFDAHKKNTRVIIASRYQESQVYPISFENLSESLPGSNLPIPGTPVREKKREKIPLLQLRLF